MMNIVSLSVWKFIFQQRPTIFIGEFGSTKFLSIAESIFLHGQDEWPFNPDPHGFWVDSLNNFLERIGLSKEEAESCSQEARKYAILEKAVGQGQFTCFICGRRLKGVLEDRCRCSTVEERT